MAFPDQSANLTLFQNQIDEYAGQVDSQFAKSSFMRSYYNVRSILGTNTLVNSRMGETTLQKLVAGQRPESTVTKFGTVSVTVDTTIIAREQLPMLNEFQTHIDTRMQLGRDQGKKIAKFFDTAFLIMGIKAAGGSGVSAGLQAGTAAPTPTGGGDYNGAFKAGKAYKLASAGDEVDAAKLYKGFKDIITKMEEEDVDTDELVIFVRPAQYSALIENDFLIDTDFSAGNGDRAHNTFRFMLGVRVVKTNRIPQGAAVTDHLLGSAYNTTVAENKCVGLVMHPKSLLAGETIPLQHEVWFNKEEKMHFIDSWLAFGVAVDRADVTGAIYAA